MKKLLLSLLGCAVALSGMAFEFQLKPAKHLQGNSSQLKSCEVTKTNPIVTSLSRAEETIPFNPSAEPYQALQFKNVEEGMLVGMALEFTAENANAFAGNTITDMTFWTGIDNQSTKTDQFQSFKTATVFVTNDLQEKPFYTKTVDLPRSAYTQLKVALDTPIKIEAGKSFYVGYYYVIDNLTTYPYVVDYTGHPTDQGGWAGISKAGATSITDIQWSNLAGDVGFNCIGLMIKGSSLPKNKADVIAVEAQPIAEAGKPFLLTFAFDNQGVNSIDNIDVEVQVGNDEPFGGTVNVGGLAFNEAASFSTNAISSVAGDEIPVTVTVTKVNGVANTGEQPSLTGSVMVIPEGSGFKRRVLFEEYTGNWCGWCPKGIEACEYVRENMINEINPVAIHFGQGEPMSSNYFSTLLNKYNPQGSAPLGFLDRIYEVDPELETLLDNYEIVSAIPSRAKIECDARISGDSIIFVAKSEFYKDMDDADKQFIIGYTLTQDGVGPYKQNNYYNDQVQIDNFGGVMFELGEWNSRPAAVDWMFNDVARYADSSNKGLSGSVPASVKAGETYTYEYKVRWRAMPKNAKFNIIVYLMNPRTRVIENSWFQTLYEGGPTGVEGIVVEEANDAPVEYYNLQGVRVANPENGLYIRRQGKQATKVFIR